MALLQKFDEVEQNSVAQELHGIGPLTEEDQLAFDQTVMDEARRELQVDGKEQQKLGLDPVQRYQQLGNVVVPSVEIDALREQGQDVSVHASAGRSN